MHGALENDSLINDLVNADVIQALKETISTDREKPAGTAPAKTSVRFINGGRNSGYEKGS